jgi:hypothetical protein
MWEVLGAKGAIRASLLAAIGCLIASSASAEDNSGQNDGFSLPGVTLPQGTDEVRAADGTSCRSAVGGSGAYLDLGVIGKPGREIDDNSYYARVVVPLGSGPKRLNCALLYELEVERLKLELELAKAGLGRQQDTTLDNSETSSLGEDVAAEEAAPEDSAEARVVQAAVVEETVKKRPAVIKKPVKTTAVSRLKKKKKIGNAGWDDLGWSTDGRQEN